jgi:hypothetical protein
MLEQHHQRATAIPARALAPLSVRDRIVPIFLDFADAADSLAGAFAFHGEARNNRMGIFSDINFIRLSTDVPGFQVAG